MNIKTYITGLGIAIALWSSAATAVTINYTTPDTLLWVVMAGRDMPTREFAVQPDIPVDKQASEGDNDIFIWEGPGKQRQLCWARATVRGSTVTTSIRNFTTTHLCDGSGAKITVARRAS